MQYDLIIRNVQLYDGSGSTPHAADVAVQGGRIAALQRRDTGKPLPASAGVVVDAGGLALAPGFIDVHTHDDTNVISQPDMLPKISQGITTVIVGNCGISASPVLLRGTPPDPMNLLGDADAFRYPCFGDYRRAVDAAQPAVNVAALVGHTALRNNHMDRLDRCATPGEINAMQVQLREALENGALGLSSGLAYSSAVASSTDEVQMLAEVLDEYGGVYTTHLRTEFDGILDAMDEAFTIGRHAKAPVIVSHLKCAGAGNWGRSTEVIRKLEGAAASHPVGCDCYPYAASSSTLDLKQVTSDFDIVITWSTPHPEMGGRKLADIAIEWGSSLLDTARQLQPAGAVYYGMDENDVRHILGHPLTMVGSDGLPNDPLPHPRLWGAFPRVLGHYSRDVGLFPLAEAIRKMTSLSADRFGLADRGRIAPGLAADLVLFDPATVRDTARFDDPARPAEGIHAVWVNGVLSYQQQQLTGHRAGRFLPRSRDLRAGFH
ncbi:N-acyl-D-amino-acid deacylase [Andreprevotia lacus DSM 23236]|jgi:N-acyl-D-amino-acid deacylase|uniref:N-acyl-D-amino-acid deacylase n=1 Tax=Andreprevotia lacus DSM 23236 TaxID=1121001 RepID=A0A1W1XWM1_9NEIS|nr:D-aminoacylase [Andreprevotia lacus]SMC27908.1 N-acyl-D-amino-acid deacylase [Andreprevotia lacus DSM 23236]